MNAPDGLDRQTRAVMAAVDGDEISATQIREQAHCIDWQHVAARVWGLRPHADLAALGYVEPAPKPREPRGTGKAILMAAALWAVQWSDDSVALGSCMRIALDNGLELTRDEARRLLDAARKRRRTA